MTLSRRTFLAGAAATLAACTTRDRVPSSPPRTIAYGPQVEQVADLYLPEGTDPRPAVVLAHGGFWRAGYDRTLMSDLAADLVARGYAVWNIDYRSVTGRGRAWPALLEDAAAAADHLATLDAPLDLTRVAAVGHSAGGHLALWLAGRDRLPAGAPSYDPVVRVRAVVGQAPVADLVAAQRASLGSDAVEDFIGGPPEQFPGRYAVADPCALVPLGARQVVVHGTADTIVPIDQSLSYQARVRAAGGSVELVVLDGVDHFAHLDPHSSAWGAVTDRLPNLLR